MHSFDKLSETYGEQGAVNLTSLARTKLILATADIETAKRCADFIGNREVRQMDEAYSYGYNNTRDAATLTPRKVVEPLVIPDDITNLPAMHGFVKFPDGFPAARIKLAWRDDPIVAQGFMRRAELTPAAYQPPPGDDAEEEAGGPEAAPVGQGDQATVAPLSEAERAALALVIEDAPDLPSREREPPSGKPVTPPTHRPGGSPGAGRTPNRLRVTEDRRGGAADRLPGRDTGLRVSEGARGHEHEDQLARETREGAGVDLERDGDDGLGL